MAPGARRGQPRQRRALGAVAVKHVRRGVLDVAGDGAQRTKVGRAEFAGDGDALKAERKRRCEFSQHRVGARAAGHGIDDQADAMAARRLAAGDVEHVTEQAAKRRPQDVHDLQRRRDRRRGATVRAVGSPTGGGCIDRRLAHRPRLNP